MAALAYLSVIPGHKIHPLVLNQTVNKHETVLNFPLIYVNTEKKISARSYIFGNNNYVEIPFSKLYDFTSYDELVKYVNKDEKTLKLELGSKIQVIKNGCIYTVVRDIKDYCYIHNNSVQNFPRGNTLEELAANTLKHFPDAKVVD